MTAELEQVSDVFEDAMRWLYDDNKGNTVSNCSPSLTVSTSWKTRGNQK